jgi:hypothetical protein
MNNVSVSAQMFIWMMTSYGISMVITQSKIFQPIRNLVSNASKFLGDMINCIMCFGFWVGLLLSLVMRLGPNNIQQIHIFNNLHINTAIKIVLDGFATSGFVWIVHVFLFRLRDDYCEKEEKS